MRRKPRTIQATCSGSDSAPADGLAIPLPPPPPQLRQMLPAARPTEQQQQQQQQQQQEATTASLASSSDDYSYNEPSKQKIGRRSSGEPGIQLTPVWEYVARQHKFPPDVEPRRLFQEISERLRDPEWQVRQHALRVLIDVLPCLAAEDQHRSLDELVQELLLRDLVDNLGNSAPAVRKGSLDALRIYLLHSGERDLATKKILRMGMDRPVNDAEDGDRVLRGVLLSTPLLLFPSRSTGRPSSALVREATRTLAMHLVQVQHQEAALRSLVKIRDSCDDDENGDGLSEVDDYLRQIDESIVRNFELLCDVYGLAKWESDDDDEDDDDNKSDSDTSGIAEVDDESSDRRSGSGSSVTSARIVLETEIKFNEETAITMTILEEQDKEVEGAEISEETSDLQRIEASTDQNTKLLAVVDEKKKLPRRVHFGGEIVKLRTPDSEDASSIASSMELSTSSGRRSSSRSPPPTRIPLPVAPATRLPVAQPRRSLSQPTRSNSRNKNHSRSFARRRSASSSPKRDVYVHDASLSPKKSILAKSSDFGDSRSSATGSRSRSSRRDSYVATSAVAAIEAPAFQIYEEPDDVDVDDDDEDEDYERTPSPGFLGEACGIIDGDHEEANDRQPIESVFGDRSDYESYDKIWKNQENKLTRSMQQRQRSNSALETPTRFDYWQEETDSRRRSHSAIPGYEVFPRQERNYILMELSSPSKTRRASLVVTATSGKGEQSDEKPQQQQQIDNKDDEDEEKIALDAKEKSSSDGSDVEWKSPIEESWEELGLVDDEILNDFHNKTKTDRLS
ncbi:dentin sialophosphoprotein-like [Trichogramma pretiosum]|uniref:dentin sialophosphoprotein-like n=1 Tax=Trichogramma pretiosum TaxID=7493 RepID=UPI000C718AE0|nr:dentin sialophosphoprotein-like [Trichogramma pretiosum]